MLGTGNRLKMVLAGLALAGLATGAYSQEIQLPAKYKEAGVLKVGLQNTFPPLNFVDPNSQELTGFNIDLWRALEPKLGVKVEFVIDAFPSLFPALDTGRSDLMGAGVADTMVRREKYTFVDYLASGPVFATTIQHADAFKSVGDICGKTVGWPRHVATFGAILENFTNEECVAKGLPAPNLVPDDLPLPLGLSQNRYQTALFALEGLLYTQQTQPDTLQQIGEPLRNWLFGIAFVKGDTELRDAIAAAVDAVIADGTYADILTKYNMTPMAVPHTSIDKGET